MQTGKDTKGDLVFSGSLLGGFAARGGDGGRESAWARVVPSPFALVVKEQGARRWLTWCTRFRRAKL
jgi:hypothetical protein